MQDPFGGLMAPWQNAQQPMANVLRWGNFPDYGQTLVEHNNALPLVLGYVRSELADDATIDWLLLSDCVHVHDHGEPLSGGDQHAANKTLDKELLEYQAFAALIAPTKPTFRAQMMRAFLLQYVRKPQWEASFCSVDQAIFRELSTKKRPEAAIFNLVERLDYLASAVAGHSRRPPVRNDVELMIDHTLNNQVAKLDALVVEYPALGQVWTPELRKKLLALGSV